MLSAIIDPRKIYSLFKDNLTRGVKHAVKHAV
jgi:hypothetical protein